MTTGCYTKVEAVGGTFWPSYQGLLREYDKKAGYEEALFLKLDDDIVFIGDGAIEAMALAKRKHTGQCGTMSANVVNHAELDALHQQMGAYKAGYIAPHWTRDVSQHGRDHYHYEYDPFGKCSLNSFDCAKNTHLNFLHNVKESPDLHMCVPAGIKDVSCRSF